MRKIFLNTVVLCLALGLTLTGCGTEKASPSKVAIEITRNMKTTKEKVNYLIAQAKTFYNSQEFQEAIDIAQYILRYLDRDSQETKKLLNDAKEALIAKAKSTVEEAKKSLPDLPKFGE